MGINNEDEVDFHQEDNEIIQEHNEIIQEHNEIIQEHNEPDRGVQEMRRPPPRQRGVIHQNAVSLSQR